jgi:hypothetical protein
MMIFLLKVHSRLTNFLSLASLFFSFILGLIISWIIKNDLTEMLFGGMIFNHQSLFSQFVILVVSSLSFTVLLLGLFFIIRSVLNKNIIVLIQKSPILNGLVLADVKKRLLWVLIIIGSGFLCLFFINNILPTIDTTNWMYVKPNLVPAISPIGYDFRIGSYQTAFNLVHSHFQQIRPDGTYSSIYPPFVSIFNIPYLLFNENTAYLVHVGLLFLANSSCLVLAGWMAKEYLLSNNGLEDPYPSLAAVFLVFAVLIYTLTSYSFTFSFERGNTDIFAMVFTLLAMWSFLKAPHNLWLQVILLSIATQLKIYPAALFLLIFIKHGKRLIIPVILINLALLFILGPKMAQLFIQTITSGSDIGAGIGNRWTWIGNHSAYSFADTLAKSSINYKLYLFTLWGIFTAIPLILWGMAAISLLIKKFSTLNAVLFVMVSIPLMDLIPTVSMDYKLVILSPAALFMFAVIIKQIILRQNWLDYLQLLILLIILLYIGRPYEMSQNNPSILKNTASYFVNNKYLWVLALESLMVFNIIRINNSDMSEKVQHATVDI